MNKNALIVIDIQNDYFQGGKWPLKNMESSAKNAALVIDWARDRGDLVLHVQHVSTDQGSPFFLANSTGAEIHSSVQPGESETVIVKHQINSFLDTDLASMLKLHGVESLTILGSMSHMCIDAAVRAASDLGYPVTVIEDACSTHDIEFGGRVVKAEDVHAAFMFALSFAYADVITVSDFLKN
ncbi:MAG: cysteine hydrolase [Cellvibrionaceae bacterium]|nr:cysteine hydrolase [Cellvibrionaceae bacterium]